MSQDELLAQLYPPLAIKIRATLSDALKAGLPECTIFAGLRTWVQQDALYALGRVVKNPDGVCPEKPLGNIVTKACGGDSFHNYGLAVDLVFRPSGKWSWDSKLPWAKLGEIGARHGLEWGGSWKFSDHPHFQMIGKLDIPTAKKLYSSGGIAEVWKAVEA